jgi:hypothetical protein
MLDFEKDLKTNFENIKSFLTTLEEQNDSEVLLSHLQDCYNLRHDILHYFVNEMLLRRAKEMKLGEYVIFKNSTQSIKNKTPDIFIEGDFNSEYYIIDLSVSINPEENRQKKISNYSDAIRYLIEEKQVKARIIIIACSVSFSNIDLELMQLEHIKKRGLNFQAFMDMQELCRNCYNSINTRVPIAMLKAWKKAKFQNKIPQNLKFANKLDFKVQGDFFEVLEKVGTNKIIDEITGPASKGKTDGVISYLKDILERGEESDIFREYLDREMDQNDIQKSIEDCLQYITLKRDSNKNVKFIFPCTKENLTIANSYKNMNGRLRKEQEKIYKILKTISVNDFEDNDPKLAFVKSISVEIVNSFETYGMENDWLDVINGVSNLNSLRSEYRAENKVITKESTTNKVRFDMKGADLPFYSYAIQKLKLKLNTKTVSHPIQSKAFKLNLKKYTNNEFLKKTKLFTDIEEVRKRKYERNEQMNLDKENYFVSDISEIKEKIKEDSESIMNYLKEMSIEEDSIIPESFINFMTEISEVDSDNIKQLKLRSLDMWKSIMIRTLKSRCANTLYHEHLMFKELLHMQTLKHHNKEVCFANAGSNNSLILMLGTFVGKNTENGKPFLNLAVTKFPERYVRNLFGEVSCYKMKNTNYFLCIGNWIRLPSYKITHCEYSFYQVLNSVIMNSLSSPDYKERNTKNLINELKIRMLFSTCLHQRNIELLVDSRYFFMSAISTYTNIRKLLTEKLSGRYINKLTGFIIQRLYERLPFISKKVKEGNVVKFVKPVYLQGERISHTTGGNINLPSLWLDRTLLTEGAIQNELFYYCLTLKEPSSHFHEVIKAINVINKYQTIYQDLDPEMQLGLVDNNNIYEFLSDRRAVGCSAYIVYDSVTQGTHYNKLDFEIAESKVKSLSDSDLFSTKAVIHDGIEIIETLLLDNREKTKRKYRKAFSDFSFYEFDKPAAKERLENEKDVEEIEVKRPQNPIISDKRPRIRVAESLLDNLIKSEDHDDLSYWINEMMEKRIQVKADICIKSQYGAKREFYVLNNHARVLSRMSETFFKEICNQTETECISVPGDKKLIKMQKVLDNALIYCIQNNLSMIFVNGDSTKWSASETMSSFISMVVAMRFSLSEEMYALLLYGFSKWGDKLINIPKEIYKKVLPKSLKTEYLSVNEGNYIYSTQNFLQGMFNFASSYKFSCCNRYAMILWNEFYPKSKLKSYNLEHSDDYGLVIVYENDEEMLKFRVLQKMCMRLHGMQDSSRKTSLQSFFFEFVSLTSFNGTVVYPTIKKFKEVNSNLAGIGYVSDSNAILSRCKESSRVGASGPAVYFQMKLSSYLLADLYSVLPGQRNSKDCTIKGLLKTPVENFGIIDVYPQLFLFSQGDINNYRIYHYGSDLDRINLVCLHKLSLEKENKFYDVSVDLDNTLMSPDYTYHTDYRLIKMIRKNLGVKYEEIKEFWEDNHYYKYLKPRNKIHLIKWIKAMFFTKGFSETYLRPDRPSIEMRYSTFSSGKILKMFVDIKELLITEGDKVSLSIVEFKSAYNKIFQNFIENIKDKYIGEFEKSQKMKYLLSHGDNHLQNTYDFVNNIKLSTERVKPRSKQAIMSPMRFKTFELKSRPEVIILRLLNKELLEVDWAGLYDELTLEKDINTLENYYGDLNSISKNKFKLRCIYNDIIRNKTKRTVIIGFDRRNVFLEGYLKNMIEYNTDPCNCLAIIMSAVYKHFDLIHNVVIAEHTFKFEQNFIRKCLESILAVQIYFEEKLNYSHGQMVAIYSNLTFYEDKLMRVFSCKDVLNQINEKILMQTGLDQDTFKIAAYLKAKVMGDFEYLEDFCKSAFQMKYKYIKTGVLKRGRYTGETICSLRHMNKSYLIYKMDEEPSILIMNPPLDRNCIIAYNAALRITGSITNTQFNRGLLVDRIHQNQITVTEEIVELFKRFGILGVLTQYKDSRQYKEVDQVKIGDSIFPILISKEYLGQHDETTMEVRSLGINISGYNVRSGDYKVFTVPFWRSRFHANAKYNGKDRMSGLSTEVLFKRNFIGSYITNDKQRYSHNIEKAFEIEPNEFIALANVLQERYECSPYLKSAFKTFINDKLSSNKLFSWFKEKPKEQFDIDFPEKDIMLPSQSLEEQYNLDIESEIETTEDKPQKMETNLDFEIFERGDLRYTDLGAQFETDILPNYSSEEDDFFGEKDSGSDLEMFEELTGIQQQEKRYLTEIDMADKMSEGDVLLEDIVLTNSRRRNQKIKNIKGRLSPMAYYILSEIKNDKYVKNKRIMTCSQYLLEVKVTLDDISKHIQNSDIQSAFYSLLSLIEAVDNVIVKNDDRDQDYQITFDHETNNYIPGKKELFVFNEEEFEDFLAQDIHFMEEDHDIHEGNHYIKIYVDEENMEKALNNYVKKVGFRYKHFTLVKSKFRKITVNNIESISVFPEKSAVVKYTHAKKFVGKVTPIIRKLNN